MKAPVGAHGIPCLVSLLDIGLPTLADPAGEDRLRNSMTASLMTHETELFSFSAKALSRARSPASRLEWMHVEPRLPAELGMT
ncbi:MAG: hypothetical protein ACREHF_15620, partial [Rhizomicrobium sp.]